MAPRWRCPPPPPRDHRWFLRALGARLGRIVITGTVIDVMVRIGVTFGVNGDPRYAWGRTGVEAEVEANEKERKNARAFVRTAAPSVFTPPLVTNTVIVAKFVRVPSLDSRGLASPRGVNDAVAVTVAFFVSVFFRLAAWRLAG